MKGWVGLVGWPVADISGHPSAAGRAWNRESSPVKDQCSTTVQRSQPGLNILTTTDTPVVKVSRNALERRYGLLNSSR